MKLRCCKRRPSGPVGSATTPSKAFGWADPAGRCRLRPSWLRTSSAHPWRTPRHRSSCLPPRRAPQLSGRARHGRKGRFSRPRLATGPWPLVGILVIQAGLSLRLVWSNTAYQDEALYLWAGHLEWAHWLHGVAVPDFASYFSGAPVIYPPLGAVASSIGGLATARILSLACMLAATTLLYAVTKRPVRARGGHRQRGGVRGDRADSVPRRPGHVRCAGRLAPGAGVLVRGAIQPRGRHMGRRAMAGVLRRRHGAG